MQTNKKRVYVNPKLAAAIKLGRRTFITMDRASTILPNMVGMRFSIHNGKRFEQIKIEKVYIGHKLGEYVVTKQLGPSIHYTKKNIKKKRKFR